MLKYLFLILLTLGVSCKSHSPDGRVQNHAVKETVEVKINRLLEIPDERRCVVFSITLTNNRKEAVCFINHAGNVVGSIYSEDSPDTPMASAFPSMDFRVAESRDQIVLLPGVSKVLKAYAYIHDPVLPGKRYRGVVEVIPSQKRWTPPKISLPKGVIMIYLPATIRSAPFPFEAKGK
jgi:hypothetical protein